MVGDCFTPSSRCKEWITDLPEMGLLGTDQHTLGEIHSSHYSSTLTVLGRCELPNLGLWTKKPVDAWTMRKGTDLPMSGPGTVCVHVT